MKAGLLECDHVDQQYCYIDGDYSDMFNALFPDFDWQYYDVINGQFPDTVEECEVYFFTGSRFSVYNDINWIKKLKEFVKEVYAKDIKMIGVCFGHQLIAEALGGKVEKSINGWSIGNQQFKLHSQENWMNPYKECIYLQMMCQDQVICLPENAQVLASTDTCEIAMYKIENQLLAIQGHPEFSRTYAQMLMIKRTQRIGERLVRHGLKSLDIPTDQLIFKNWVMNFLKL